MRNASTGDVVITAQNGNITGSGLVTGNNVTLDSATGVGVSTADRVNTAANTLAARSRVSGGVFLAQAHAATLASIGGVTNTAAAGAPYNLNSGGLITIGAGGVNTGGTGATTLTTTAGGITLDGNDVGNTGSATALISAANITGTGVVHGTDVTLDSATGVGTDANNRLNTDATTLAARTTTSGSVFISEANDVSLATIGGVTNSAAGGGGYNVTANGAITVNTDGVTTANGQIALIGASITNNDTITNGGGASTTNILLRADSFNLHGNVASQVEAGAGAVVLTPNTVTNSLGIEAATQQTNITNADLDTIHTTNFVVLGSSVQGFTGNTIIGQDAKVDGGAKSLAFFRNGPGTTTIGAQGVTTTGDVIVNAGGGNIVGSPTGIVAGNHVQLRATNGIGTAATRVKTSADVLAVDNFNIGAFVTETDNVSLADVNLIVGGNVNNAQNLGRAGTYSVTAGGAITVDGNVSTTTGGITLTADSLTNNAVISNGGTSALANIALLANEFHLANPGAAVNAGLAVAVLAPRTPSNSFGIEDASAQTHVTNADIATVSGAAVVFGSPLPGIFTGNMTIGVDNTVAGGNKTLAFLRDPNTITAGTITIGAKGLTTTGNVAIGAGGHGSIVSLGGTIGGNLVSLTATDGIGTSIARVNTSASTLAVQNQGNGSGAFVQETNDVSLANISQSAAEVTLNTTNNGGTGAYDVVGGRHDHRGHGRGQRDWQTRTTRLETTAGDITIGTNIVGRLTDATTLISAGNITGTTGVVRGTAVTLDSATGVGTDANNRLNTAATTLAARTTTSGGVFVNEADGVSLNTIAGVANSTAAAGEYNLLAGGAISVDTGGVTTANGTIRLDGSSITNNATISNGVGGTTNILLKADAYDLVGTGGAVQGGAGAVILTPHTLTNTLAIESDGGLATTTLTNNDLNTITTTDFVVLGSSTNGFVGNTIIGQNAQVDGGLRASLSSGRQDQQTTRPSDCTA